MPASPPTLHGRPALVFDLDGTLVDSLPDLAAALNRLLVAEGRRRLALDEVKPMIGDGVAKLVERAVAATGPASDPALPALIRHFVADYEAHAVVATRPFPGVPETLADLRAQGYALAVCTNKPYAATIVVLERLRLAGWFEAVVAGDSLAVRKPDARPLLSAIARLQAGPEAAVMVGDNANDIATARGAGVPVVAVAYGYSRDPIRTLGADVVIERFDQLPRALATLAQPGVAVPAPGATGAVPEKKTSV
jgi:phosphoglycolate phosphatase